MGHKLITSLAILLLFSPLLSEGQIWKRTEEEPEPIWRIKGSFTWDFYPYSRLNNEKFYTSVWGFNYTVGVELLHTTKKKPISWGGGLIYSVKDFTQKLKDTGTNFKQSNIVEKAKHEIRYTELPVIFEYELMNTEKTQLFVDGGITFGLRETAVTYKTSIQGKRDTLYINDQEFARFLFGAHYGFGFRQSLTKQLSLETGLTGRLYLNDLGKNQYVNFSSFGVRLKLVYQFSNKVGKKQDEK